MHTHSNMMLPSMPSSSQNANAKAAVASLQMGGRQVRLDEKGERVFLDDQEIAQETARAKQEAAAACN